LKILASELTDISSVNYAPGTVISLDQGKICIACKDFAINVLSVIPEGKGKMKALDYINGRKLSVGDILS
jgi:methionyl-tRNA formyltransferase